MTARVEVTPEADADITEAYSWYRGRGLGLGEEFLRSLDACLDEVARFPDSNPVVHHSLRRALIRRFPYCVFYLVQLNRVVVIGLFHARRDPGVWQRRSSG